jgi:transposase
MRSDLTDAQWRRIRPLLPKPAKTGRPRADDRQTLNGILWVLRSGARWQDVPRPYGSPTTCWRRLVTWQLTGTWTRIWQALLASLDAQDRLRWSQAFLDGSFVPAKKGGVESV